MGFISYHGKKEDRYSEILEYSKAIQNEEWAKSEEERISNWLKKLTGDEQLAHLNLPELLKSRALKLNAGSLIIHGAMRL